MSEEKMEMEDAIPEADMDDVREIELENLAEELDEVMTDKAEETEEADERYQELEQRFLRTYAEYENFRKRTEREKEHLFAFGMNEAISALLPVLDNLERAISATTDESTRTGLELIYRNTSETFEKLGVKEMEAEGKPFDPNLHNAAMRVPTGDLPENSVAQVLQKGYIRGETVLRHAMVSVTGD